MSKAGLTALVSKIIKWTNTKVTSCGAQYYTFAIFGLTNYPLSLLYEYYIYNNTHVLYLRSIATLLCLGLLFHAKWPQILKEYLAFYWYLVIIVCLPVITTFLLLDNNFSLGYLVNSNIGVMIVILLVDWASFLIIETIGISIGIAIYYIAEHKIPALPKEEYISLFFYMFFCIVALGTIFTRNKEIYSSQKNKIKDELNFELEKKVAERTVSLQNALSAKTEFLNNMSHEIRTPIHGFTNISEGLVSKWDRFNDTKKRDLAAQIASNARRLANLVGGLLDMSKFQEGKMLFNFHKIDINKAISSIIDECTTLYLGRKKIKFIHNPYNTEGLNVIADEERISQVLRNLIVNAIKYSDTNSTITVRAFHKIEGLYICVSDEGIGIPREELDKVFEPFTQSSRTKTGAGGTGLGLSISKEIILGHGGNIWAENNKDKGTSVYFTLPVFSSENIGNELIDAKIKNHERPLTILMVDDEDSCFSGMELILSDQPYNLIKVDTGKEALKILRDPERSKIDLILLDLMMPEMSGEEVLDILKSDSTSKHIPVIIQTGSSDEELLKNLLAKGVVDIITKPYKRDKLLHSIEKIWNNNK